MRVEVAATKKGPASVGMNNGLLDLGAAEAARLTWLAAGGSVPFCWCSRRDARRASL